MDHAISGLVSETLSHLRCSPVVLLPDRSVEDIGHSTDHANSGLVSETLSHLRCSPVVLLPDRSVEDLRHSADHAMSGLVPDTLSHLSESHLSYFTHWLLCMDLETASQHTEGLRSIWCMSSSER